MYGRNCCGGLPRPFRNTTRGASSCSRMTRAVSPPTWSRWSCPACAFSSCGRTSGSPCGGRSRAITRRRTFCSTARRRLRAGRITGWRMCSNTARYSARITGRCSLRNCTLPTAWICGAMRGRWGAFSPAGTAWRSWVRSGRITAANRSWKSA